MALSILKFNQSIIIWCFYSHTKYIWSILLAHHLFDNSTNSGFCSLHISCVRLVSLQMKCTTRFLIYIEAVCKHGKTGQNFLIRPYPTWKYLTQTPFFGPKVKNGLTRDLTRTDSTHNPNPNHFLKLFFLVKKKLRQYWFNCLLWVLRKQLRHLHNCMQINWKMNNWAFCNK